LLILFELFPQLSLLTLSNLSPIAQVVHVPEGEIYDATFSATTLVVVTTVNLLVYALPSVSSSPETVAKPKSKKGKEKAIPLDALKLLRTVKPPSALTNFGNGVFRGARFHPKDPSILYTVTNTVPTRSRNTKSLPRQGLVAKWNTEEWKVEKVRKVGEKGLTCFDVSSNGKFIGFGSSDCSIGLLDANTLAPAVTILKAHDFPPTTLRFNPTSTLLVSGSADNSIRIVSVPDSLDGQSWVSLILIVLTLLMILLAIAAQALIN
jgi:prolactin regulatory element-binding protein